jgi:hypothetical protein
MMLLVTTYAPGCIPCKVYAEDTPILTIDRIVIYQTHAEDLRRRLLKMHPGLRWHRSSLYARSTDYFAEHALIALWKMYNI